MQLKTKVAAVGINNEGKSTVLSALIGEPICEPKVTESTAIVATVIGDAEKAEQARYGVRDRDGQTRFAPLSELRGYTPEADDECLFLYHSATQTDFNDVVFIDVPGRASISNSDHNRRAAEFVANPRNYDILLDIMTPRSMGLFLTRVPAPTPRIVLINKVDEHVNWSTDAPLSVIEQTVAAYKQKAVANVEDSIVPSVIAYSAIVGLAAETLDDDLLNRVLAFTKTHGKDLLMSTSGFFRIDTGRAIVDAANTALTQPWWHETRPAYPAIRFAIGLALHEGITDCDVLRQRMHTLSGVGTLRQTIRSLTPLTALRCETLKISSRYTTDTRNIETELAEIRALMTDTDRLWHKHKHNVNLASTQELAYLKRMRTHLTKEVLACSKHAHQRRQAWNDTQQQYINAVNETVSDC